MSAGLLGESEFVDHSLEGLIDCPTAFLEDGEVCKTLNDDEC
jgi:hypothetical protein